MTRFTDLLRALINAARTWHRHALIAAALFAAQLMTDAGIMVPAQDPRTQHAVINIWVQIAIMIVAAIVSYALAPKPPTPKPAALSDFDVPTAEEGRPIPVIFGTVWITGPNVLWYGDLRSVPIRASGGKK